MTARGATTRDSGLDTSNGLEFVQHRIGLFAKIIALISIAFMTVGAIGWAALAPPGVSGSGVPIPMIANLAGLVVLLAVWLLCRFGRFSLVALERLDAVAIIATCTAWAFFIDPPRTDSVPGATISVAMTAIARSIMVPSKTTRTLRLTALAAAPVIAMMWGRIGAFASPGPGPADSSGVIMLAMFQTLLVIAAGWMAVVTSRTLYDLRRSVREANELGQYVLEEKLGAGGMGEVWRARHRLLVRPAAIKIIRAELLAATHRDPGQALRRFEREARATAALRSPHTVQLYDFGETEEGALFYVMELLVGIDLENLVTRFGPIPAERAIHILKQVCQSLEEAHRNGLTHRDIKPANVFVSGIGTELDFAKVLDFGLVGLRAAQPVEAGGKMTTEAGIACTPAYAAPEIARGEPTYDHRVDIYAVGCVAYWLVTGELVFTGTTAMQMLIDHASTPPPRPQTRTELPIPRDLEDLIMECLEKDPARRPAVPQPWTGERADTWWRSHAPTALQDRPVADVLLSSELRALQPRRRKQA
jgi:hypothetical protein